MKTLNYIKIKWAVILMCLPFIMTSCWEDLPTYDGADITKVGFYHRFAGPDKDQLTGEPIMVERELTCEYTIDNDNATVNAKVTVPEATGSFTETERNNVQQNKLWGYVNLSTAARISPIDGSKPLGTTADDWTQERRFRVKAANGDTKIWTIRITEFNK